MVVVMLTLLMIQLQSFSRLILVFLTAPLGIVGASLGLNVANKPFGFVALLGLIALAGMIMRNAVILVDQIESDVAHGLTRLDLPGLYALWFRKSLEQRGSTEQADLALQHRPEPRPAFPLAEAAE